MHSRRPTTCSAMHARAFVTWVKIAGLPGLLRYASKRPRTRVQTRIACAAAPAHPASVSETVRG